MKMDKPKTSIQLLFLVLMTILVLIACDKKIADTDEIKDYVKNLMKERAEKDSSFQFESHSPFNRDTTIEFENLKYYEPNPDFIFKSKLFYNDVADSVVIMGTKGEARVVVVLGYVELNYKNKTYKVNVYRGFAKTGEPYHSIWFTDRTTGKETYGVGRYLDFELQADSNFVYTIDFNKAYNPYCAYSALYTCPIPREEDFIDISIEAGEKYFH